MRAVSYAQRRAEQTDKTLTGGDLIAVEIGQRSHVITVDELNQLLSGATTLQGRQEAFRGCRVGLDSVANNYWGNLFSVEWSKVDFDSDSIYNGLAATALVAPSDATKVRVQGNFKIAGFTSPDTIYTTVEVILRKNDEEITSDVKKGKGGDTAAELGDVFYVDSGPIDVAPNDIFTFYLKLSNFGSILLNPEGTWGSLEVVEQLP